MNTTLLKEFTTTASAGYMGAVKTEGSKSGVFLYGGELSKAIKKALQDVLTPELKRSDISARVQTYTGGQNVTITLKLSRQQYAPTLEEFKNEVKNRVKMGKYNWIWAEENGAPVQIFHEKYYALSKEDQEKAEELTAEKQKEYEYNADSMQINHYYINKEIMLNDKAKELLKVANTVILAFNRDDSNSMVDYFDTNFYYSINIKWI